MGESIGIVSLLGGWAMPKAYFGEMLGDCAGRKWSFAPQGS
jgi:hypothetical protein